MTVKAEAQAIVAQLQDDASWDDLIKELIRQRKITIGMRDEEINQTELNNAQVNAIVARLHSSHSLPDDMRNTNTYRPGNATTLGMVSGVLAVVFAFIFPPIAWLGAAVAVMAGGYGISKKEEKAWIPILLAMVSLLPFVLIFS
ncbi:MAG: hypothetical protein RBS36_05735 [Thiomicrospira sp.]|jgi:hypothetical protein|nr:hypothetical protein [Thiomicrospira sp.]